MFTNKVYKDDLKRVCKIYKDLDLSAKTAKTVTKRYLIKLGDYIMFASDINIEYLIHRPVYISEFDRLYDWDGGDICFTWYIVPISTVSPLVSARAGVDI